VTVVVVVVFPHKYQSFLPLHSTLRLRAHPAHVRTYPQTQCICAHSPSTMSHLKDSEFPTSALFFFLYTMALRHHGACKRMLMIVSLSVYLQDTCAFSFGASLGSFSGFSRRHASFLADPSLRCRRSYSSARKGWHLRHMLLPLHVSMTDWQQATDTATG
jgi:hypothetical protein